MPFRRGNRFITFLIAISAAMLISAGYVSTANDGVTTRRQDRIIDGCLLASVFAMGFARLEWVARKTKHDLRGDINSVSLYAQHAANNAETAVVEARAANATIPDRVVQKINGGLEKAAKKVLDESPFPTTHEELEAFVKTVQAVDCLAMIDRAIDRMQERGWKPPEK